MARIDDVAAYILENLGSVSTMKLQKLAFYSQAYYLVEFGAPLFSEKFEAWANGPVAPELFRKHRGNSLFHEAFLVLWMVAPFRLPKRLLSITCSAV